MKKYIIMALTSLLILSAPAVKSQTATVLPVIAGDSLATADTVFKSIPVSAGYNALGVQVDIKKATGTLDGKLYLYTSINGGRFVLTDSSALSAVVSNAYTTNSGYTHTAIIQKVAPAGSKYIAAVYQNGSLTASRCQFSYTARKY